MPGHDTYTTYRGKTFDLTALEADERELIERLQDYAASAANWYDYQNL